MVLVNRTRPGPVTLTGGGEVLLRHARVLLTRADRARDEVRTAAEQPEQVLLRIAPGAEVLLAPQLRRLTHDATLGVTSATGDALLAVRDESADAAVVWDGRAEQVGLTPTALLEDVAVHLALPPSHRLAGSARIHVTELADESIVMFPRPLSPHAWDTMHDHLLPDGPSGPGQVITESNALTGPAAVLHGVAAGKGVGPTTVCLTDKAPGENLVLRPLDPPLTVPLQLTWREPAGPALQRVIALLLAKSRQHHDR